MSTVANSEDGLSRMVQNPKRYFREARARAAAQVDDEMRRDRRRTSADQHGSASSAARD